MRLVDISPQLDASSLVARFVPPPRFAGASFDNYTPDAAHPSQSDALATMREFALPPATTKKWFRKTEPTPHGLYLDGGFGVGKTHLLTSLFHAWPTKKAYATFTELTAFIGFAGMNAASEAFGNFDLVCVDEFELDDVANTLMVVSFLRALLDGRNTRIAVTSNTLPDRLGEQRFSASEFKREIAVIASYFDELRIDGADFRATHAEAPITAKVDGDATVDDFDSLIEHLGKVHPAQYGAMFDRVSSATINGVRTITNQDDALLFVQLVDKLYDANIPLTISGCEIDEVFAPRYRNGGYRKKYGRAESRLLAMI